MSSAVATKGLVPTRFRATRRSGFTKTYARTGWIDPMATSMLKRRGSGGRPRLNRARHAFNPRVEIPVYEELAHQADESGIPLSTYLECLLAEAHDYHGEYLRDLSVLPISLTAEELKERTAAIGSENCLPLAGDHRRKSFKADEELAIRIAARCDELNTQYAEYLRAVFREATGYAGKPVHEQPTMVEVPRTARATQGVELKKTG